MSNYQKPPYHRAARFPGGPEAGAVYFRIQELIDHPECELSAYRFLTHGVWHVAIIGDAPNRELAEQLERHLSGGETVELPVDTLDFLRRRRQQQIKHGPWVERHHRPGRRFRLGK
ncbi:MAG: hypothetical protein H8E48_11720 [Chloroflexi bacterium]|nr:hypothetical protein [Chloroflexota bacterium]